MQAAAAPTPLLFFFFFLFFLCSILAPSSPHSALAELTPSIHVFVLVASSQTTPPATRLFFFSSSLVSSFWPFVRRFCLSPVWPNQPRAACNSKPHHTTINKGPKEPFQGSVERDWTLARSPATATAPASTTKQAAAALPPRPGLRETHTPAALLLHGVPVCTWTVHRGACSSSPAIRNRS